MSGRTVLVTGATGGIGLATAVGLADMGAHLVITGRDPSRADDAVRAVHAAGGGRVDVFLADLSSQEQVRRLAGQVLEALPRIDRELKEVRWQSAWRLRRGRALLGQGQTGRAQTELRAALAEMEPRIRTRTPDLLLVADRGLAHALLGDRARAVKDLETVRAALPSDRRLTRRLEAALKRPAPGAFHIQGTSPLP